KPPQCYWTCMIRIIITDIDGTLLDIHGDLAPGNAAALKEAAERGVRVALASIRKRDSTARVAQELGLPCTLVCDGGATIYDESGVQLRHLAVPLDLARAIGALVDEHRLPLVTTIDEINYYTPGSHPAAHIVTAGQDVASASEALVDAPTRLIVRGEMGVALLMREFANAPLRFVRHYHTDGTLADAVITHADATKESALATLCQDWGIAHADVLALGDAEADIGMLRLAGVGVAVGNAHPDVKAAADWVAPSAGDGGLAAAVRRFVL
ncbi:MAG TPA: HAD family hydrolase, partial [Roseiflexaceae bacterium]|nr:HAD family hydrolase [Roseiflexaceae bacterium]